MIEATCPYCESTIDYREVMDPKFGDTGALCPECNATRAVVEALVDGDVTKAELKDKHPPIQLPPSAERERQDELPDPAERNSYTGRKEGEQELKSVQGDA